MLASGSIEVLTSRVVTEDLLFNFLKHPGQLLLHFEYNFYYFRIYKIFKIFNDFLNIFIYSLSYSWYSYDEQ